MEKSVSCVMYHTTKFCGPIHLTHKILCTHDVRPWAKENLDHDGKGWTNE